MTLASAVAVALLFPVASRAAEECAPKPSNPVGYEIAAVHADAVPEPATTPPIAILDSGVAQVPELEGRVAAGDDSDSDGHGTAVASVAAAQAGGVRGVSPTSPIIPIRILDARGEASLDSVINGIRRAVALGAGVINISAAAPAPGPDTAEDRTVQNEIFKAVTRGILVVAPTGNEGTASVDIPARYPHVVAVAGTDESGVRASFSNSGAGVDLAAPGANLTVAAPTSVCASGYALVSGTSFSAPLVAGAAAMLKAANPKLDPSQLTDMLRLHAPRSMSPAWNASLGFGRLDVASVLAAPIPAPDAPEVDDTIAWAKLHPLALAPKAKRASITAHVATHSDPADVFRVRLSKGDKLTATLSRAGRKLGLQLLSSKATLVRGRAGKAAFRAPRTGEFYVRVAATAAPPQGTDYTLSLKRS
jgi:hypothetical protein